jgi:hypothetical protein
MRALFSATILMAAFLACAVAGCEASALRYAKHKNPGCEVTPVVETNDSVRVIIQCPHQDPFERVYRAQQ